MTQVPTGTSGVGATVPGTVPPAPPASSVAVLDGGWTTTRDAEHAAHAWAGEHGLTLVLACTHFHQGRVLVTAETVPPAPGPSVDGEGVAAVVQAHRERTAGRVFVFPGQAGLPGATTVGDVVRATAVEEVVGIGGDRPDPGVPLDTQDFVRPELAGGVVRLRVRPATGGRVVPFEQPNPTPCCAAH